VWWLEGWQSLGRKLSTKPQNSDVNAFLFGHNHDHGKATVRKNEYCLIKAHGGTVLYKFI